MYVMMVVSVVTIWGLRHGDVTHHVYPTVIAVGLALVMAEARLWLSYGWFWGIFSTIYAIILISNAMFMSMYGIWSFCELFSFSSILICALVCAVYCALAKQLHKKRKQKEAKTLFKFCLH